jgi:signal peptidase II
MSEANEARAATLSSAGDPEGSGLRWLPVTVLVIVLDQIVKAWVVADLKPYQAHHILPVLDFTLMFNTGAAWSFLADASGWQRGAFIALAAVVSLVLIVWMYRLKSRTQGLLACALALIAGGALGNMIDRIRIGHVVDFIFPHWNDHWFPAFNVADSCITIGAALLLLDAIRDRPARPAAKAP